MARHAVIADDALIELRPLTPPTTVAGAFPKPATIPVFRWLLVLCLVVPSCLAAVYYLGVASDRYVSETRFLVRSPQRQAAGLLSGLLQSTGFVRAQDDSFAVAEFIRSRAAVQELERDGLLSRTYSRPEADPLARYPRAWGASSQEGLFRHYLGFVVVANDSASGVTTLRVRAFRPDDAQAVARSLVERAETLINRLNERARKDALRHAESEVARASDRLTVAQARITLFRNREGMVDPDKESGAIVDLIARLSTDAAEKRARLREFERQAPRSPQIAALRGTITATEDQVRQEREKLVGRDSSVAPRIASFEQLILERELATRMLVSATTSLENARVEAQRQQIYLERIVEPNLPDHPTSSWKFTALALFLSLSAAIWGICRLLLLHLLEHVEP